jgi:hypothetical protein
VAEQKLRAASSPMHQEPQGEGCPSFFASLTCFSQCHFLIWFALLPHEERAWRPIRKFQSLSIAPRCLVVF